MTGVLMAAFAGWAVYRGTDGAATTGFVAAAALFILLAIAGVMPSRIRSGDHEIELLEEVAEVVDPLANQMNREQLTASLDELDIKYSDSNTARAAKMRISEHRAFEWAAGESVELVAEALKYRVTYTKNQTESPFDMRLESIDSNVSIYVILRMTISSNAIKHIEKVSQRLADRLLIVSSPETSVRRFRELRDVHLSNERRGGRIAMAFDLGGIQFAMRWLADEVKMDDPTRPPKTYLL
ncbi:hypothetical protein GCM10022204_00110 [Microlunatus aurantiacus]|uniref:Uncharacterized protein n=1 Tax=Microlunatus aurantiacus TaxID=446786 RepID=A0ABP7CJE4_9ACTN